MRWSNAIVQKGGEVSEFIASYLARADRHCALICGAGFDPRTLAFPRVLPDMLRAKTPVLCIREERPKPQPKLRPIADAHAAEFQRIFKDCSIVAVDIFDEGNSVVGGRRVLQDTDKFIDGCYARAGLTDILVDISALSCSVFFPIVARLLARIESENSPWNLHLFVVENPAIDIRIRGEITDTASHFHGFRSPDSLIQSSDHAALWVPVLSEDNEAQMRRIYSLISQQVTTVDISPIVPFPSLDPRRPDVLVEHYRELIGEWEIDPRHLLYAAESDPLDSYHSICEIDALRRETYGELGGSSTIVSPLGSKMLSVGLMLAAIERHMRAVYVECRGYEELEVPMDKSVDAGLQMTHLWLHGEIYRGKG